ncbi:MAG: 2-oxoglutarate dehydrogenase E1 component [Pseudomonadota bacterium]
MESEVRDIEGSSFLYGSNAVYIEELYLKYLKNKDSVDQSWSAYFDQVKDAGGALNASFGASWGAHPQIIDAPDDAEVLVKKPSSVDLKAPSSDNHFKAKFLAEAYRERGHFLSKLDPLNLEHIIDKKEAGLSPEEEGFDLENLNEEINLRGEFFGMQKCALNKFISMLDSTYSKNIGFEFSHLTSREERNWLYSEVECATRTFSPEDQSSMLQDLVEVEGFERYLHVKFPGAKRFSVEGIDASIIALQKAIEYGADNGISDVILGMAHRGRLSTLVKVMGKPYRAVFSEFMGTSAIPKDIPVSGDVKYHIGYSSDATTKAGNKVHLSLAYNPSHLEAINPVVAGKTRAQQDVMSDSSRKKVMGMLVHGDGAFCGQGVVPECLIMSGLDAYNVGGIFHIITNNQVSFTANPEDQHPGRYATEVAKIVNAPIIHVNGDDIEAVVFATHLASKYRHKFGKDVVLDIIGYRKYGHNEGDEPMYTQPVMYDVIKTKQTPAAVYANDLVAKGVIAEGEYQNRKDAFKKILEKEYDAAKDFKPKAQWLEGRWSGYKRPETTEVQCITGVEVANLKELGVSLCREPENFAINPKLVKLFGQRKLELQNGQVDWATAEQLAFATLLSENIPIRLTGEDAGRGTFSHRHSVLYDQRDGKRYIPLNNLSSSYAKYEVADSNLSEYGVLGFEYGYSLVNPKHLVIWEAQYGDFANGAQIIFDQFISSAETKWLRMSGLVVLLPHGYEGGGSEHSSARLERFLQLAAEDNMQIVNPTTPASLFHLLRRQMHRDFQKPLIVMSPKSLLRHKLVVSSIDDLASGTSFLPVIGEIDKDIKNENVKRVIMCSGKVYYDLLELRRTKGLNIAIIRIEQYYPFPKTHLTSEIAQYKNATEFIWCQEEPQNMGAWYFIKPYLSEIINSKIEYIGREPAASPAVGSLYLHNKEQQDLLNKALSL